MKTPKKSAAKKTAAAPTRAGRRPKRVGSNGVELSRDAVIQCAIEHARREPISDISMVKLARALGVAPGLVHYYVGNRDDLLTAVINFAFKERFEALPALLGQWRKDLEGAARATLEVHLRWPGLAAYIASHNRFRLFQRVQPGETDYGLAFFDHLGRIFKQGGFSDEQAGQAYHLLMLFVVSVGAESAYRQAPREHEPFIVGYVSRFDSESVAGAAFMVKPFSALDSNKTFEAGLSLLLAGFESWLRATSPPSKAAIQKKKPV